MKHWNEFMLLQSEKNDLRKSIILGEAFYYTKFIIMKNFIGYSAIGLPIILIFTRILFSIMRPSNMWNDSATAYGVWFLGIITLEIIVSIALLTFFIVYCSIKWTKDFGEELSISVISLIITIIFAFSIFINY